MHDKRPRYDETVPMEPRAVADYHRPYGPPVLLSTVVHYEDAPDECTLYPRDATEAELVTTWLTAREGSFVALEDMR
jgi:hypothetical protein